VAFQNPARIGPGLADLVRDAGSVADQAARFRKRAVPIDDRYRVAGRERNELYPAVVEEAVGTDHERIEPALDKSCGCCIGRAAWGGGEDFDWPARAQGGCPRVLDDRLSKRAPRVDEYGEASTRYHLIQEPKPLGHEIGVHGCNTGEVSAWPVEIGDET